MTVTAVRTVLMATTGSPSTALHPSTTIWTLPSKEPRARA